MNGTIDKKRLAIYVLFAYGIAWLGLAVVMKSGIAGSLITDAVLAQVILVGVYMGAPAIANVLTRLITREGWKDMLLRPKLRRGWPYYLLCWVLPPLCIVLGAAVFFALFPQNYDATLSGVLRALGAVAGDPWVAIISQTLLAVLIAPLTNVITCLGEELGWRAYLQPKLMPLGGRKAILLTGVIWGVWHWPLIAMGHNYGLSYPGAPWLGMLVMIWFTVVFGTLLGWATLRAGSVWPAVIGHAVLNEMSAVVLLFVQGQPNLLLGPAVVGLIGSVGLTAIALVLYLTLGALDVSNPHRVSAQKLQPAASSPNPW
jgi:membrane protease YdiL (CAAX protease family)